MDGCFSIVFLFDSEMMLFPDLGNLWLSLRSEDPKEAWDCIGPTNFKELGSCDFNKKRQQDDVMF